MRREHEQEHEHAKYVEAVSTVPRSSAALAVGGKAASDPRIMFVAARNFRRRAKPTAADYTLARRGLRRPLLGMKVSFTTKEYARLLELVHLGLWMAGARPDDPATMPERYAAVTQKAFGLAEAMGCADLVEVDVNGQYFPSEKLTAGAVEEKIDRFVEDAFWSELVSRLAERDLRTELGPTKMSDELTDEEEQRLAGLEDNYWREFENKGVEHLVLLRGGKG